MEQHLLTFPAVTIEGIADNGGVQAQAMGGMDTKLVGSAGQGGEFHSGTSLFHSHFSPEGSAEFAVDGIVDLKRPVGDIEPELKFDFSAPAGDNPVEHGDIHFSRGASFELFGELPQRLPGSGKNHDAGGVHIQPVDGGILRTIGEQRPNATGNAVLLIRPSTGDGQQAAGFVHDDDILVEIEQLHGRRLSCCRSLRPQSIKPRMGWHLLSQTG